MKTKNLSLALNALAVTGIVVGVVANHLAIDLTTDQALNVCSVAEYGPDSGMVDYCAGPEIQLALKPWSKSLERLQDALPEGEWTNKLASKTDASVFLVDGIILLLGIFAIQKQNKK